MPATRSAGPSGAPRPVAWPRSAPVTRLTTTNTLRILAALRSNRLLDRLASGAAFGLLSIPAFILAELLVYAFAVRLHLLPATAADFDGPASADLAEAAAACPVGVPLPAVAAIVRRLAQA